MRSWARNTVLGGGVFLCISVVSDFYFLEKLVHSKKRIYRERETTP